MRASVFANKTLERGPRLAAADSPLLPFATRGVSPPELGVQFFALEAQTTAAYGPVSSGRPWKTQLPTGCPGQLVSAQFWPMRVEPLAVMEPSAWWRNKSWATPVPAYAKAKVNTSTIAEK